jgi:orotate phosphoribosyltransferase
VNSGSTLAQEFVAFALQTGVLRFGDFKTKAGRMSPYFFNAGLFNDGATLAKVAEFYARRLLVGLKGGALDFDMLFGPAYKGITLASAVAMELARRGHNVPFAFNRKEAKDHGEGGVLVGAPVRGRVLIIDDVISAGTSVRESIQLIKSAGATPCGVAIALDRQERATHEGMDAAFSAVQYVTQQLHLPVQAIATLQDLLHYLQSVQDAGLNAHAAPVRAYREKYGV